MISGAIFFGLILKHTECGRHAPYRAADGRVTLLVGRLGGPINFQTGSSLQ